MSNKIMVDIDTLLPLLAKQASYAISFGNQSKDITHRVRSNYYADLFGKTFDFTSMSDLDVAKVILVDMFYLSLVERGFTERNPFHETWNLRGGATMSGHYVRERTSDNVLKYINEIIAKKPSALMCMSFCMAKHIVVPMSWVDNKDIVDLMAMFGAQVVGAK